MRLAMVVAGAVATSGTAAAQGVLDEVRERLRSGLELVTEVDLAARDERLHAAETLPQFYLARLYRPAWSDERGPLALADSLVAVVRDASRDGLRPADYHLAAIRRALGEIRDRTPSGRPPDPVALADLDLLLTDAFLIYGSHLLMGRVNPETIDPEWRANRRGADLAAVLAGALREQRLRAVLEGLLPQQMGYRRLREAFARYREIAARGGWPAVPEGPALEPGMRDLRVPPLRTRLVLAGDLAEVHARSRDPELFDEAVEEAVGRFQRRHGLAETGVVAERTLVELNVPVEARLHQTELNLERWRWLPDDLGPQHVLVNIAGFELTLVDSDSTALRMRAMVGRPYRRTPVFSGLLTYLVLAPYWHVPHNLAVQDILPQIRRDPAYLARQRLRVFEAGGQGRELAPESVDWRGMRAASFPYRLRQDPGPGNALGRVKFMFPNRYNVYLHDTPARELFDEPDRAFSSGCIRVEWPIELALYLLRDDARWDRRGLEAAINRWQERTVPLPRPVPVHILYWTAWADHDGNIQFRSDLYGRDALLDRALHAAPPAEE